MRKVILACALLGLSSAAWAQGVPNSSTVVAACGTPPTTYTAGQNKANLQDTNGYQCQGATVTPNNSTIAGAAPGTTTAPSVDTVSTIPLPSPAATAGIAHAQTAALGSNLVAKAAAGNLYSFEVSADSTLSGAAWWVLLFDATSKPADGAVTPALCYAAKSGDVQLNVGLNTPVYFATGITIVASTTGCFTLTNSAHAFIGGAVK